VHKLHSKQEDVFCLECRNYNTPFIWLFFLLNFAFAFKISGNSNLSPHIRWTSNFPSPLCQACLPHERLFQGETDGSSFPNGGLRVTHSAAAFTTWDRASPPFVMDKCHLEIGRVWETLETKEIVQLVVGRYAMLCKCCRTWGNRQVKASFYVCNCIWLIWVSTVRTLSDFT